MSRKVILTCAVVGSGKRNPSHPYFPITPQEIADSALEAERAGASCVHLHVRNPKTGEPSRDPDVFLEMATRVRESGCKAVMNITCGDGGRFYPDPQNESRGGPKTDLASAEERVRHIEMARPEMCSLDVTTMNQANSGTGYVYLNTEYTLRKMAGYFKDLGVKPEIEVFGPGDVLLANKLIEDDLIGTSPVFQFVMGARWAIPATTEALLFMKGLLPPNAIWGAFGIARMQMPMVAQTAFLGGNVRVGLEDNLYLKQGVFATNEQLVERAKTIIECMGMEVATPDEAREMMGLN